MKLTHSHNERWYEVRSLGGNRCVAAKCRSLGAALEAAVRDLAWVEPGRSLVVWECEGSSGSSTNTSLLHIDRVPDGIFIKEHRK